MKSFRFALNLVAMSLGVLGVTCVWAQYNCRGDCIVGPNENLIRQLSRPAVFTSADLSHLRATEGGIGCLDCQNGVHFQRTGIIDEPSARPLTPEEDAKFGLPVGSIDCRNQQTGEGKSLSGFLVKKDIVLSVHAFLLMENGRIRQAFEPSRDCVFSLRSAVTGKSIDRIPIQTAKQCPRFTNSGHRSDNCEWDVIRLKRPVTDTPIFRLKATTSDELIGRNLVSVAFHSRIGSDGVTRMSSIKQIDYGVAVLPSPKKVIFRNPEFVAYTMDSTDGTSGSPIFAEFDGENYVVAIAYGGFLANGVDKYTPWPFDPESHFNYGQVITREIVDAVESMSAY